MAERRSLWLLLPPLALAVPAPAQAETLHLAICGGGRTVEIPLPGQHRDNPCPTACHAALCERSRQPRGGR